MSNNNEKKIVSIFKKFIDIDESVKRIPIYFFLVCVLLVVLIFKISQTNEYLKEIAENGKNNIEYETFDDTFIEISTEETKNKEDYIPLLEEVTDNENLPESTTIKQDITLKETTTQKSNDNIAIKTYVLNTSSKKIHLPDCSFAIRTKEENKKSVELSNEELNQYKNDGYVICKTCGGK